MIKIIAVFLCLVLSSCSGGSDDDVGTINGAGDGERSTRPRDGDVPTVPAKPGTKPTTPTTPTTSVYPDVAGHGILWKPVSDSTGKLAILLAPSYGVPSVTVLSMAKQPIESGVFVYKSNPNRATYRFGRPGGSFPAPCLLQVGSKIFKVTNPSRRYE